jgi:hypothetical protein
MGRAPEPAWTLGRRKRILAPSEHRTPVVRSVAIPTEVSQLRNKLQLCGQLHPSSSRKHETVLQKQPPRSEQHGAVSGLWFRSH